MLVEFRVRNFLSFKQEAVLSMVAAEDIEDLSENTISTGHPSCPKLLRTAAMYGANGAGKSNFLKGIYTLAQLVRESFTWDPLRPIPCMPFQLGDPEQWSPICSYQITLIVESTLYEYSLSHNTERFLKESLVLDKGHGREKFFERIVDDSGGDSYSFGESVTAKVQDLVESVRQNALFLSTAVRFETAKNLIPMYEWLTKRLLTAPGSHNRPPIELSLSMIYNGGDARDLVLSILQNADLGISSLSVTPTGELMSGRTVSGFTTLWPFFQNESDGTKALFAYAGPLLGLYEKDGILIIDELDSSLHPHLVKAIVEMFHDSGKDDPRAQLVFTTHDVSLIQEKEFLRRDQVWFVDKNRYQESSLSSLLDFTNETTKERDFGEDYLRGGFGGIPIITGLKG
jgi:uncharacterized protein